jgi:hypothetical protein
MEKTWAFGAVELLRHADSHIDLDSAFDKRIAFISIDNSVETSVRAFLSLPEAKSGVKIPRAEVEAAGNSFPKLVALLFKHAGSRLSGIDPDDMEHYHRIRNQLYHDGTGFSVDDQYLGAYRSIAALILQSLFDVALAKTSEEAARLDTLILNWNRIDQNIQARFQAAGIDGHTWKWEEAFQKSILTPAQVQELTELRMARNRLVHSTSVDEKDVAYWARKSAEFLSLLQKDKRGG